MVYARGHAVLHPLRQRRDAGVTTSYRCPRPGVARARAPTPAPNPAAAALYGAASEGRASVVAAAMLGRARPPGAARSPPSQKSSPHVDLVLRHLVAEAAVL